jgi:hypothetical protein
VTDASDGIASGAQNMLCVVGYGAADRRMAERLARAGLYPEVVEPEALASPQVGALYLMPADCVSAEVVRVTASQGAHVCLMPPWPDAVDALPGGVGALAPAQDRSGVRLTPALEQAWTSGTMASTPVRALRILYRDQLVGAVAQALAETATGEMLLAAMPRTSNRQGQVVATTLLVSTPSAQTLLGDVAVMLRLVLDWLRRVPVDRDPAVGSLGGATGASKHLDERWPQIALLALALALPGMLASDEDTVAVTSDELAVICATFGSLERRLGQSAPEAALEQSWTTLQALGIVAPIAATTGRCTVRPALVREYLGRWQLLARMRRLRPMDPGGE